MRIAALDLGTNSFHLLVVDAQQGFKTVDAGLVLGTVLFTGLAGVVFCELRRRSGSLLASAGLHWATNGLGVLTAASVWAWASR